MFEVLINYILPNNCLEYVGPTLQLLTNTVNHLPLRVFSGDENLMELSTELFIMKNQIYDLINSKTVGLLFELLLAEGP